MTNHDAASLAHQLELVTLERDMLRQALDEARAREQESRAQLTNELQLLTQALQRVEHVEREARQQWEKSRQQVQQLEQRLQEAQTQQAAQKPKSVVRTGVSLRPSILELLQKHPEGLTRAELEAALPGKRLDHTIGHMMRAKLLRSLGGGRVPKYVVAPASARRK